MRFPLLHRFQGALLGAWIGASINRNNELFFSTNEQLLPPLKLGMTITEHIIKYGQITDDDWLKIVVQNANKLGSSTMIAPDVKVNISSGAIALFTLPLALFFHELPHRFSEYLYSGNKVYQQSEEALEEIIIWKDALTLILREKVNHSSLIPQLLEKHFNSSTLLMQQLEQVQSFLAKKMPLQQGVSQLSRAGKVHPHEIALACYCFSYTPQEFYLAVKQGRRTFYQPSLTAALTGILAGVYNGISGIPVAWRLRWENTKISQEIYQQATGLLAVWSGVVQPSSLQPFQTVAIASPLIIQPRPSYKMISQEEV